MQFPVEPIAPGYEARLVIAFANLAADALELTSGELVADLRFSVDDEEAIFTARTADETIEVVRGDTETLITVILPAEVTGEIDPDRDVMFDFVRISGAGQFVIPGRWRWPVRRTVTRDV